MCKVTVGYRDIEAKEWTINEVENFCSLIERMSGVCTSMHLPAEFVDDIIVYIESKFASVKIISCNFSKVFIGDMPCVLFSLAHI